MAHHKVSAVSDLLSEYRAFAGASLIDQDLRKLANKIAQMRRGLRLLFRPDRLTFVLFEVPTGEWVVPMETTNVSDIPVDRKLIIQMRNDTPRGEPLGVLRFRIEGSPVSLLVYERRLFEWFCSRLRNPVEFLVRKQTALTRPPDAPFVKYDVRGCANPSYKLLEYVAMAGSRNFIDGRRLECYNVTCHEEGILLCSNCNFARYCSPECQKANWQYHKSVCGHEMDTSELDSFCLEHYGCEWTQYVPRI